MRVGSTRRCEPDGKSECYSGGKRMLEMRNSPFMMPGETTQTDLDWSRLQGTVLEGGYQLESILSADAVGATFKVRVLGDASANSIAKLFGMDPANAAEQAALWESTRELDSTNLLTPLGAGQTQVDGASVAYLVVRRPDEVLEAAIRERPLSTPEASEVLLAVIRGLDELHSHGFVQGSLSPEHIVAAGDAIKLSVECVGRRGFAPRLHLREPKYRAPESAGQYVTPEADVWCLGATLIEILSQQPCGDDCMAQAAKLPAPFDGIARRCLDPDPETRPKLGQVEVMYRSTTAPPPAPKKFEVPVTAAAPPAAVTTRVPLANRVAQSRLPQRTRPAIPAWMYAAAAVIVIVLLVWIARPKHRTIASASHAAASSTASSQPSAWESKTITPDDAKTVTPAPVTAAKPVIPARQSPAVNGAIWRVVLYTYARSADADSKARSVNAKYPGLNAETFSPAGGKSLYLVVVGGRMTREDAERLRQRVRAMGLPRDSYTQNFKQ